MLLKSDHYLLIQNQQLNQSIINTIYCNDEENFISGKFGPEYDQLGLFASLEDVENVFRSRASSDEVGSAVVRVVEVGWRTVEARSSQGCPVFAQVVPGTSGFIESRKHIGIIHK